MLDAGLQKGVGIYPGEGWCMPWCPHAKVPTPAFLNSFSWNSARKLTLLLNFLSILVKAMSRDANERLENVTTASLSGTLSLPTGWWTSCCLPTMSSNSLHEEILNCVAIIFWFKLLSSLTTHQIVKIILLVDNIFKLTAWGSLKLIIEFYKTICIISKTLWPIQHNERKSHITVNSSDKDLHHNPEKKTGQDRCKTQLPGAMAKRDQDGKNQRSSQHTHIGSSPQLARQQLNLIQNGNHSLISKKER